MALVACGPDSDSESEVGEATESVVRPSSELFRRVAPAEGPPAAFIMAADVNLTPDEILAQYAVELWHITPADELVLGGSIKGENGTTHHTYVQWHAGYPVAGGAMVLAERAGRLHSGGGVIVGGLQPDLAMKVSQGKAKQTAIDAVGRSLGLTKKPKLLGEPEGELIISRGRLAWRFEMLVGGPLAERRVDVDAVTGGVLTHSDMLLQAWDPVWVDATGIDGVALRLRAETDSAIPETRMEYSPLQMAVRDCLGSENFASCQPITAGQGGFTDPNITSTQLPSSLLWSMESAQDFLWTRFGLSGLDNAGGGVIGYVNFGFAMDLPLAAYSQRWDSILVPSNAQQLVYDVFGHEIFHAVEAKVMGLTHEMPNDTIERAALWESYSDIFGINFELWESHARPDPEGPDYWATIDWFDLDWSLGTPVIRRLDDPTASMPAQSVLYRDPAFLQGDKYVKAGVQSKWFHLLATGGATPVPGLVGVGVEEAAQVAIRTMLYRQPVEYQRAAEQTLHIAIDRCGEHSQLWASVTNAWREVGLLTEAPYEELHYWPVEADRPAPWPTRIEWVAGAGETAWQLEIVPVPDFDAVPVFDGPDYRGPEHITTQAGVVHGEPGAYAEVNLRPDTIYAWRVRANLPNNTAFGDNPACFRPTHKFRTAAHLPVLESLPPGDQHPWELALSWSGSVGAEAFDLELLVDGAPWLTVPVPKTDECPPVCDKVVSLPVDADFSWRVRARGPHDLYGGTPPNATEYAASGLLHTSLPTTTITSPEEGAHVYPWNVEVGWEGVPGAAEYLVWAEQDGVVPPESRYLHATGTEELVQLQAMFDERDSHAVVHVVPVGPMLEGGTHEQERGADALLGLFVDGSATIPCVVPPGDGAAAGACGWDPRGLLEWQAGIESGWLGTPPVLAYGSDVILDWSSTPIAHAAGYRVRLYEIVEGCAPDSGGVGCEEYYAVGFEAAAYEREAAADEHVEVVLGEDAMPSSGSEVIGYWYTVEAIGPDGRPSPTFHSSLRNKPLGPPDDPYGGQRGDGAYWLQPPAVVLGPIEGAGWDDEGRIMFESDGNRFVRIHISQAPEVWSPTGNYQRKFYKDTAGCSPESNLQDDSIGPYVPFSDLINLEYDEDYSYQCTVRRRLDAYQYATRAPNNCVGFHTTSSTEQLCGDGVRQSWEACDEGPDGGPTCTSDCRPRPTPPTPCGSVVVAGQSGVQFAEATEVIDLGGSAGSFMIAWDTLWIPDRIVVRAGDAPGLGQVLYTTDEAWPGGCVGTWGVSGPLAAGSRYINVTVRQNCDVTLWGLTEWVYLVGCPSGVEPEVPNAETEPGYVPEDCTVGACPP